MSEFSRAQREELRDILSEVVRETLNADFVADFAKRTIDDNETSRRIIRRNEPYIRRLVREEMEEGIRQNSGAATDYLKSAVGQKIIAQNIIGGELSADYLWSTSPDDAPEGWQLREPVAVDGWYRYERKRS